MDKHWTSSGTFKQTKYKQYKTKKERINKKESFGTLLPADLQPSNELAKGITTFNLRRISEAWLHFIPSGIYMDTGTIFGAFESLKTR
ncbi:hypothetical protein OZ410_06450 [Robiginitalea sp. M366]|uniref:hypothetical protein n=1 Tax=Robiginitalea aestuariiviva TaxID=3036903 RepID=UPI00240CF248|nr:hypothetical protein [Robiginitalea aestuariiviva]MDG1571950.1 hypothetical protein [Robiginitalea aestuariiviva]